MGNTLGVDHVDSDLIVTSEVKPSTFVTVANDERADEISFQIRNIIVQEFSRVIASSKIPVLDMAANTLDLAKLVNTATNAAALLLFALTGHVWWHYALALAVSNVLIRRHSGAREVALREKSEALEAAEHESQLARHAGAQSDARLFLQQRLLPAAIHNACYVAHPQLAEAVRDFLEREQLSVRMELAQLDHHGPAHREP